MTRTALAVLAGGMLTAGAAHATGPDAEHGAQVYGVSCAVCHGPQGQGGQGPALAGVIGRKAAQTAFAFSKALKAKDWTWTPAHLDAYLANPQGAVPGTLMPAALPAARDREDVIAFLRTLKPAPTRKAG